jgi:putative aldouronate transport system substrate-binding protein
MRWLDWFMTEEGSTYGYFGEKGVTWKDADPGTTGSTDHQARIDTTLKVPANYAYTNNAVFPLPWWWDNAYRTSWVQPKDMLSPDGTGSEKFLYQMTLQNYVPYGAPKSMIIPPLYYDTANVSEMAVLRTNINTYVEEAIAKFIVGQMNIDTQWDQFQKELKNLGIDRYLQIIQETYNKSPFVKK